MRALYLLLATISTGGSLLAQSESIYSSIEGDVTDSSGAAAPGVSVAAKNITTNISISATTDEQGHYRIERLIAGEYVTAERPSFKKFLREGVTVSAAQSVRVMIALEVGQLSETVTVSGGATLIQTETQQVSVIRSWDARKYLTTSSPSFFSTTAPKPAAITTNPSSYVSSREAGSLNTITRSKAPLFAAPRTDTTPPWGAPMNGSRRPGQATSTTTPRTRRKPLSMSPPNPAATTFTVVESGTTLPAGCRAAVRSLRRALLQQDDSGRPHQLRLQRIHQSLLSAAQFSGAGVLGRQFPHRSAAGPCRRQRVSPYRSPLQRPALRSIPTVGYRLGYRRDQNLIVAD